MYENAMLWPTKENDEVNEKQTDKEKGVQNDLFSTKKPGITGLFKLAIFIVAIVAWFILRLMGIDLELPIAP